MKLHCKPCPRNRNLNTCNKKVILVDVNIPYNFSIDRKRDKLFFCINADEVCDQSFQSAVADLNTGCASVIPNVRNGFASAVDQDTGTVYLAGSDGIFKYNNLINDIEKPALIKNIDVFDMKFNNNFIYFIDTANMNLFVLKNGKKVCVATIEEYGIQHFTFADQYVILSNANGLYYYVKENCDCEPVMISNTVDNIRGLVTDLNGLPHIVAQRGLFFIDLESMDVIQLMCLEDGYALDFDKNNNIIYSDGRTVIKILY